MTNDPRDLERQIDALVRAHLEACRAAAVAAVGRALASSSRKPARQRRARPAGGKIKRRTPAELAALSERFHAEVRATPGETMRVLAERIGVRAAELHRPVVRLKRDGLVRSVGERYSTRYFPTASTATERSLEVVREGAR